MSNIVFFGDEDVDREQAIATMLRHGLAPATAERIASHLADLRDCEDVILPALFAEEGGWQPHTRKDGQAYEKKKGPSGRWIYRPTKEANGKGKQDDLAAGADLNDHVERGMYADRLRDAGRTKEADEHLAAAEHLKEQKTIADSYRHMTQFVEFQDGVVEIPRLFKEASKRDPSLTHEKFQEHLKAMAKSGDIKMMAWEGGRNSQGGRGMLHPEHAIKGNDDAYPLYYVSAKKGGKMDPDGLTREKQQKEARQAAIKEPTDNLRSLLATIDKGGYKIGKIEDDLKKTGINRHADSSEDFQEIAAAAGVSLKDHFEGNSREGRLKSLAKALQQRAIVASRGSGDVKKSGRSKKVRSTMDEAIDAISLGLSSPA